MTWRSLLVQKPAKLTLKNAQLHLENDDGVFPVAVEDLVCVVLESHHVTVSAALLARCQDMGVCVITCDAAHTPNGVMLPFHGHSRQTKVARMQASWSEPFKKRAWQIIVRAKVCGQAAVLEKFGLAAPAKILRAMCSGITSGDEKNIEAQAAREYWRALFNDQFRRQAEDCVNGALNYGYAIIRAAVARSLVSYGLLPVFGLHHDSELNAFNLADDVVEVFRPLVDDMVKTMHAAGELDRAGLTKENRQKLAGILNATCAMQGEIRTLTNAADKAAERLVAAIEAKDPKGLVFPEIRTTLL